MPIATKRGPGRPRKADSERRDDAHRVPLYPSAVERAELDAWAARKAEPLGRLVLDLALRAARRAEEEAMMARRRSLSKRVRHGLQLLARVFRASNANVIVGAEDLTRDERDSLADVARACEWIDGVIAKNRPKPRKRPEARRLTAA